jgi:hypothetical protein
MAQRESFKSADTLFTALRDYSPVSPSNSELGGKGKAKRRKFDEKINIMNYKPPSNSNPLHITKWEKAVAETWGVVRAYPLGGNPLREFIHKEVGKLKILREELFAMVPEEL